MPYDPIARVAELTKLLVDMLYDIEQDEKEIRRLQERLRERIQIFRATMSERDAVERVTEEEARESL